MFCMDLEEDECTGQFMTPFYHPVRIVEKTKLKLFC